MHPASVPGEQRQPGSRGNIQPGNMEELKPGSRGDLKLLLAEVGQYVGQVRAYLAAPSIPAREDLRHKLAYINTLALMVRNQIYDLEAETRTGDQGRRYFHGLASIAGRLHRVADLALNVARQFGHLRHPDFMNSYGLDEFFEEIELGLSLIRPALERHKVKLVLRLCQSEGRLDVLYADRFKRLIRELDEGGGQPGDRVTALMVVHYLERIGDLLLEIGEIMIHIFFGENLNFAQYQALGAGLRAVGGDVENLAFQAVWGGRSGCRVGIVGQSGGDVGRVDGRPMVFKHGPAAKLEKERENLEFWAHLRPGLCPEVKTFVPGQDGEEAALVMEYIEGDTLRDLFMRPGGQKAACSALAAALELVAGLWRETRREEAVQATFIRQAEHRLGPLKALYPGLLEFRGAVGSLKLRSLEELLAEARNWERDLTAPFAVRLHGDFNLSNIMVDDAGKLRFIDLYRSRPGDCAQDLSVLMMSILRLPLRAREDRERLGRAAELVKKFAAGEGDATIEARLAFGLARSFLTSARFEPRRSAAVRFLGHGRFLLSRLIAFGHSGHPWAEFQLDKSVLYVL